MKHCHEVLRNLNWKLLREQKAYCLNEEMNNKDVEHIYGGAANLISALQDAAVLDGVATEKEVFGGSPDEEGIDEE